MVEEKKIDFRAFYKALEPFVEIKDNYILIKEQEIYITEEERKEIMPND